MDSLILLNFVLIWILLLINFLLILAVIYRLKANQTANTSSGNMIAANERLPNFEILSMDSQPITNKNMKNQEYMMVFIAPGCKPCSNIIPKLNEIYAKTLSTSKELLIVSLSNVEAAQSYLQLVNLNAPVHAAPGTDNSIYTDFKLSGTPSYYLVSGANRVISGGLCDSKWEETLNSWQAVSSTV